VTCKYRDIKPEDIPVESEIALFWKELDGTPRRIYQWVDQVEVSEGGGSLYVVMSGDEDRVDSPEDAAVLVVMEW
jgi:hypothetical protein